MSTVYITGDNVTMTMIIMIFTMMIFIADPCYDNHSLLNGSVLSYLSRPMRDGDGNAMSVIGRQPRDVWLDELGTNIRPW